MIINSKIPKNKKLPKHTFLLRHSSDLLRSWFQFQFSLMKRTQNLIYSCFSNYPYVKNICKNTKGKTYYLSSGLSHSKFQTNRLMVVIWLVDYAWNSPTIKVRLMFACIYSDSA